MVNNLKDAELVLKRCIPGAVIKSSAELDDVFVFCVLTTDAYEGAYDNIYSVNKKTSECRNFDYLNPKIFANLMAKLRGGDDDVQKT